MVKFIQVTIIGGVSYQAPVDGVKKFDKLKRKATWRRGGFFDLCETCTIKRSEIISVEYFEVSEGEK